MTADWKPVRVLALSPIPEEGAGCRFRIAQFMPYLESVGVDVTLSSLFTTEFFRLVYKPGHYARKAVTFAALSARRLGSLRDLLRFDVVFIYREMFPIGPAIVERLIAARGRPPIVFDFDDAIFLPNVSDANRLIGVLKRPQKVAAIIRSSDHVITGNEYLAAYARRFSSAVTMIPTSVDTDRFVPAARQGDNGRDRGGDPIVGWIGSPTTSGYIRGLAPVLRRAHQQQPFTLRVSGVGDRFDIPGVPIEYEPWSLEREVALFNTCDVGVYPLADDEWSKGKCGFKALEFMACGVPVVAAAVGVNRVIVEDGQNGFLAATEDEWVDKLVRLLRDAALRRRFAETGRRTVQERYSVRVNAPRLAETLRAVADRNGAPA
ncbi:MAG TPA: glycosyltransferase family 4 protein [Vicinamibacterales bacterium]|nr:glycosyltransferase family 4 protein [Vicinamibacterales bacterium]